MRRFVASFMVSLLVGIGPAAACINDGTTFQKEKEFKSQYQDPDGSPGQGSGGVDLVAWGATGAGVLLFVGAVVVGVPRFGRSTKPQATQDRS